MIEIAFHDDHIFFRSEILDDGLFLTYCLGGEYPSTHLYARSALPYEAFNLDFQQTWNSSQEKLYLNNNYTEAELTAFLTRMNCTIELKELRTVVKDRYDKSYG